MLYLLTRYQQSINNLSTHRFLLCCLYKTAIQVKYRSNPDDKISYADIARTFTSAVLQLHMKDVIDNDRTVFLFTNAGGVTGAFDTVMQKKTVIITRGVISTKVDNNVTFWKNAYDLIYRTLDN